MSRVRTGARTDRRATLRRAGVAERNGQSRAPGWRLTLILALLAVAPRGLAGQVAHPGRGGAPAGLCAGGRAKPGRPGSPILRILPITGATNVAVDERTSRVFVAAHLDNPSVVCVLDARTGALLRATPVGQDALALAVARATNRVFVANAYSRSVSVLDARTGGVLHTVNIPDDSRAMAVSERTERVFLVGGHRNLLSILDARDGTVLRNVPGRGGAIALVVSAPEGHVLVANFMSDSVSVLNARDGTLLRMVHVGSQPQTIAINPATSRAFVANSEDSVSVLDTRAERLVRSVPVDGLAAEVAADGRTGRVFVTLLPSPAPAVAVLDARDGRVLHTTPLASDPISTPVVDIQSGRVLVLRDSPVTVKDQTPTGPGAVVSLDGVTGIVRHSINVGGVGIQEVHDMIAVDSQTRRAFVSTGAAVVVLDLTRL